MKFSGHNVPKFNHFWWVMESECTPWIGVGLLPAKECENLYGPLSSDKNDLVAV